MSPRVLQLCAVDFTLRNFLLPLVRFLEHNGFRVECACTPGPFFPELQASGLTLHALPISRSLNLFSHIASMLRLRRILKQHPCEILHVHTPIASLIGRFAGRTAGIPIIVYTAHGFYFHDDMPRLKRRLHIFLERLGARYCDFVFTQSDEDRQTAIREKIIAPDRILTIGNGVDIRRFSPDAVPRSESLKRRAEFGIPPDAPVIGMIGRLVREKGYLELVRAAAEIRRTHPDCHFLFVGDALKSDHDASRSEILGLIEHLALRDHVHIAGLRQDIPELLAAMNIYTLPSWREGMPRSIIEAMAMGLPVVATQIRGCREEVLDGETGFLVPPRDSAALASALRRLLGNPEQARTMGAAGRRRAQHEYAEDLVLDRQLQVFRALIREKGLDSER